MKTHLSIPAFFMMVLFFTFQPAEAKMCPDGSFVAGNKCTMAPDGSYVGGNRARLAPDGSYIGDGHLRQERRNSGNRSGSYSMGSNRDRMSLCPDGSYVMGRCKMQLDGSYTGR